VTALVLLAAPALAGFDAATQKALDEATYVYVQSERKSGELGAPAEIWFHVEEGAVYVGTRPTSWRVRRIKAGRSRARVAIGKADGQAFDAIAALLDDAALAGRLMDAFATKYPDGWKRYEDGFRTGFANGDRVLVRYTPK
jgi:hypothetical protein